MKRIEKKYYANPMMIHKWANMKTCFMCKHKLDEPWLKPSENPKKDEFNPNFNGEALFHLQETHGIPNGMARDWIVQSIYSMPLSGETGAKPIFEDLHAPSK